MSKEEKLRWEGFVEKVNFEPGVKEWRSDGWREWGWWQRWVDKWMRRWIETRMVRLTKWIWKLIPKMRWCISEWAICDFQWGDGWRAGKGNNRWGEDTTRGLNGDQFASKNYSYIMHCVLFRCRRLTTSRFGVCGRASLNWNLRQNTKATSLPNFNRPSARVGVKTTHWGFVHHFLS